MEEPDVCKLFTDLSNAVGADEAGEVAVDEAVTAIWSRPTGFPTSDPAALLGVINNTGAFLFEVSMPPTKLIF